jgi:hypothetical protein
VYSVVISEDGQTAWYSCCCFASRLVYRGLCELLIPISYLYIPEGLESFDQSLERYDQ